MRTQDFRDFVSADVGDRPENLRWKKRKLLRALRELFGMEVAFISRFTETERSFDTIDADPNLSPPRLGIGEPSPLDAGCCFRIAQGKVPSIIIDAREEPSVADIEDTCTLPVGAHVSVPIVLSSGEIYGMLCAFSRQPKPDLRERDKALISLCADLLARDIEADLLESAAATGAGADYVARVCAGGLNYALQPIMRLSGGKTVGHELFTRFSESFGSTEQVFQKAQALGALLQLEARVSQGFGPALARVPKGQFMSVNFSAPSLEMLDFERLFSADERARMVIELTENEEVASYEGISAAVDRLRGIGFRFAIDDFGVGFSNLRHVIDLQPEYIKLDRSFAADLASNQRRRDLIAALQGFAASSGALIIAEGIETEETLLSLREAGVALGQGYLLGCPEPLD